MDLRELLTFEVLEAGISDMILDNIKDLEELVIEDIHIRQTQDNNYKIYIINGEELFFNTFTNYKTEDMKKYEKCYNSFVKAFINAMKNSDRIDEEFVKDIIKEMLLYSFKKNKNSLIKYINEEDIDYYIKQGINDGLEDLIFRTQEEQDLKDLYSDYTFNYEPWRVEIEEEDLEELEAPDREWLEANEWTVGSNINEDNLIVESDIKEIKRFETYLQRKGSLYTIEKIVILCYLEYMVMLDNFQYTNFINYIMGIDRIDTEDEDEDMEN